MQDLFAPDSIAALRLAQEQVFYLRGRQPEPDGRITVSLRRREGDGFEVACNQAESSYCVRWLLFTPDEKVAAIALPSTCAGGLHGRETQRQRPQPSTPGRTHASPWRWPICPARRRIAVGSDGDCAMILFACCLIGTALCYYLGVKTPGPRGHGTIKGWAISLAVGVLLGALYYAFSAYGMLFSLDSMLDNF